VTPDHVTEPSDVITCSVEDLNDGELVNNRPIYHHNYRPIYHHNYLKCCIQLTVIIMTNRILHKKLKTHLFQCGQA